MCGEPSWNSHPPVLEVALNQFGKHLIQNRNTLNRRLSRLIQDFSNRLQHFAGIQYSFRIEGRLDRAHEVQRDWILELRQQVTLHAANAVLR